MAKWRIQNRDRSGAYRVVGQKGFDLVERGEILMSVRYDESRPCWYWYGYGQNTLLDKKKFESAEAARDDANNFHCEKLKA